jgi:hypothetical protein
MDLRNKNAYNQAIGKIILYFICVLSCNSAISQTEFFRSKIPFSAEQLGNFYSSFSADSTQVYISANDYYVHSIDKKSGAINWSYYAGTKSNEAPKVHGENVFVGKHFSEYDNKCVQLNAITGDTIQTLKIEALETQPFFRDHLMYVTAVVPAIGGAVVAYDLKKNAVAWQKFNAHGVSAQPYYLEDKIIANAEGDNWFELDYNGKLLDTVCKQKANLFLEDIKCVRNFKYLTHNQKELSVGYFDADEPLKLAYTKERTFVLGETKMLVVNNKNKVEKTIMLEEIIPATEDQMGAYAEILKAEGTVVWLLAHNTLALYDIKSGKSTKTYDLAKWNIHQAALEGNKLWLISRTDGQLVGLTLE